MTCFMSLPIRQVCRSELIAAACVVFNSRQPQMLKIEQVTGVFLRGPLVFRSRDENFAGLLPKSLVESCGRAPQTGAEIRQKLDRKRKIECAFEPDWRLYRHPVLFYGPHVLDSRLPAPSLIQE